jgi:uncharacterized membrane protein YwzB
VHAGTKRAWAVQSVQGDQMFESIRTEVPHEGTHRPALELEDTDRVAPTEHVVHHLIIKGHVVDVWSLTGVGFDQFQCSLDGCEVA